MYLHGLRKTDFFRHPQPFLQHFSERVSQLNFHCVSTSKIYYLFISPNRKLKAR